MFEAKRWRYTRIRIDVKEKEELKDEFALEIGNNSNAEKKKALKREIKPLDDPSGEYPREREKDDIREQRRQERRRLVPTEKIGVKRAH